MYRCHQHPGGWVRCPECSWSADSFPLEQRTFCHLGPWGTLGLSALQGVPQELQDSHPFGKQTGPPYTSNEKVPVLWAAGQGRLPVAVGEACWQSGLGAVGAHTFLGPGDQPPPLQTAGTPSSCPGMGTAVLLPGLVPGTHQPQGTAGGPGASSMPAPLCGCFPSAPFPHLRGSL